MALVSDFPIYAGPNYAPSSPLLDLREHTEPKESELGAQIRSLYHELDTKDEQVIFAAAETAYVISSFMQGKQIWQQNWFKGGIWELVPVSSRDKRSNPNMVRGINKMQFQVSQMLEDLISSNPDFEPNDMFKSYADEKRVKADKACWNHYEPKFYKARFNREQALSLITAGTAIEELVYDASIKGLEVFKEIWGHAEMQISPGHGKCYNCGFDGKHEDFHQWENPSQAKDYGDMKAAADNDGDEQAQAGIAKQDLAVMPQCPDCGSFETDTEEPQSDQGPSVIGREQYQLGDFRLVNREIQSVRFNIAVPYEASTWAIDKQYVPLRKIKQLFGRDIKIESNIGTDIGLDYLHKMARIGASIGGARMELGEKPRQNHAILVRMSLSAEEACEIDIPKDADSRRTVSGGELEAGSTLGDIFKDGCTILGFNGFETIYGIYPRHHSQSTASTQYFSKANAGTGRGAEDLTEIQKRVNRLDAQQVAAVEGASPGYAFVEGAIDEKHVKRMHFPNVKVPIRREFFNMTKDVNNFVKQFEPLKVAPQMFVYAQELDKMMQMTAHVVNLSGAVYGADNKTATGARILESTAQSIMLPFLEGKADARKGTIKNLLCAYRETFSNVKRKFSLGSSGNKHFSQIEIAGDEIDPDVEFVVVENSMIPQNYYVRKADYLAFANVIPLLAPQGGLEQLRATDPETLHIYSNAFGVDLGGDEMDQITEKCRLRMQDAFDLAEIFEGLVSQIQAGQAPQPGMQPQPGAMPPAQAGTMPPSPPPPAPPMPPGIPAPQESLTPPQQTGTMMPNTGGQPGDVQNTPNNMFYDLIFEELELPIKPKEKAHDLKAKWFQDYLDTQEGLKLGKQQQEICYEFILRHEAAQRTAMAVDQASTGLDMMAANAPAMLLQQKAGMMADEANQPPQPAPEPPPDTLGDSVSYKDLPPEAQHQVLQRKGVDVPLDSVKAHSKMINEKPKPAAPKKKAKAAKK